MAEELSSQDYICFDPANPASILDYAKKLEGHTFREVLDLGITPDGVESDAKYDSVSFKGGMGNLLEERYFGYRANSDSRADFAEAGIELKATCFDRKKNGDVKAGERLVLGMIAYDESIEAEFDESHLWEKNQSILLVYYGRDKAIDKYDQVITDVVLFTPPEEDLAIIREDYETIQEYVMSGRADELSESLTHYLGACTKGSTAAKSLRDQAVYAPGKLAKSRAWCYKNSYMTSVLRGYVRGDEGGDSIVKDASQLKKVGFDELVVSLLEPYLGMTDKEICDRLGLEYTGNKAQWTSLVYGMLGIRGKYAEEFEKANVSVRTVRIEEDQKVKESLSLNTFSFAELAEEEEWEESPLHRYFEETRFFFVAFQEGADGTRLKGSTFWSMSEKDIEGPLKDCWAKARLRAREGVELTLKLHKDGKRVVTNNLPKSTENAVAHVRPHTSRAAYRLSDGTEIGNVSRDADELPDGQWMTKQSFWLNSGYVYDIVKDI